MVLDYLIDRLVEARKVAALRRARKQRLIHVTLWVTQMYGEFAPSPYALRMWIKRGKIHPPPQRVHGKWYVTPSAEYRDN